MASISTSSSAACSRRCGAPRAVVGCARASRPDRRRGRPRRVSIPTIRSGRTTIGRSTRRRSSPIEDTNGYDFVVNTFAEPGERRDVRALNVNTVDEVPDSSWFTNRIGRRDLPVADVVNGPRPRRRVSLDGWVVSGGKSTGVQPGFRMTDPDRAALSDRSRPAVESRAGERRRDHRHRVLPRHRLQHGRGLPRGARSRGAGRSRSAPRFAIR